MSREPHPSSSTGWLEGSGLLHIFRTLGLAVHPAKLGLALATIILTFILGTFLDWAWLVRGGVDEHAIDRFMVSHEQGQPYEARTGTHGIFEVWKEHEKRCVFGLLGSSAPGPSVATGTPVGAYLEVQSRFRPLRNLAAAGCGVWWMARQHVLFFLLFAGGSLVLWALGGGAICRIAAVQFARDEKLTMVQALRFARSNLLGGFVLAPCIPLLFALVMMVLLAIYGLFLWIPFLGDLIGGLTFILAIIGGFIIALLLVGLLAGGSLMWPAVAAEGQDAYDAFARSLSYAFSRPWKTVIYTVIAMVYATVCWVFVNLFTYLALTITRGVVAFGTSPFGWFGNRGTASAPVSKMELLWPLAGPSALHGWPDWSRLAWYEYISAGVIGVYVMLVVGLMFAFLASFYFCASTVLYFLLRRDVDKTDLEDLHMEDGSGDVEARGANDPPSRSRAGVSLPVVGGPTTEPSAS